MKKIILLVCFIFLLPQTFFSFVKPNITTLPNGLKVLTYRDTSAPLVYVGMWYKVGSANEQTGKTGISHLLEHMLFRSTKNFPKGEAEKIIQREGGITNGFTSYDYTGYYIFISSDKLELALKIEADRMQNAIIDEKEQEPEMQVVKSELEGKESSPEYLLDREVTATAFVIHPYRIPIIGYPDDFLNIKRSDLVEYYRIFYQPKNAVLVIVGDIDEKKTLDMVKKYFGKIKNKYEIPQIKIKEPKQSGEKRLVLKKEGNASYLQIVYHIPQVGHPDFYVLDLINQILSGGKTSRLYKALIQGNLATNFDVSNYDTAHPFLFKIYAQVREDATLQNTELAILEELEKLKTQDVDENEIRKALTQIETEFLYSLDSIRTLATRLGFYETIYTHKYLETYLDNLKKITQQDIKRVANTYFTQENRTVGYFVPLKKTNE